MRWPTAIARHPRRRKAAISVMITAAAAGLVVWLVHDFSSPAVGIINSPPPGASVPAAAQSGHYSDAFISFDYPSKFKVNSTDKQGPVLDTIDLLSTNHQDEYAAVTVVRESLSSDSGLQFRRQSPEKYTIVKDTGTEAVFSSKSSGGSEQTGYIAHSGLVASISLTQPGAVNLSQDYPAIAGSLTWRQ